MAADKRLAALDCRLDMQYHAYAVTS